MASIGSVWPPARRPRLALLAAVVLSLLMVACAKASPPEGVVDDYLSDATGGDAKSALERWELSELGAAPADLAPEQFTTRVEGRGRLAQALTAALAAAGDDLRWELSGQDRNTFEINIGLLGHLHPAGETKEGLFTMPL